MLQHQGEDPTRHPLSAALTLQQGLFGNTEERYHQPIDRSGLTPASRLQRSVGQRYSRTPFSSLRDAAHEQHAGRKTNVGRCTRVVKVSDRGWPCHEFELSTTKDLPCKAAMHVKSVESSNVLPLVWWDSQEKEVPAQVSSTSLDHGSKWRVGSQKQKIRKEKEYNIKNKYAKLDNFLISTRSSSCVSASSSNDRELDEQILEVKINPQKKTVSDTSTNKDTLSKEKESENENEETKLIRNDFAHYVGRPIDLREQILKLGPYQPEGNFQNDAKGRSFSSSFYSFISKAGQKIEKKWLSYSTRLHVA
ncbi:hypothetical protein TNCV_4085531 [Trichonephila clavipes]|nr:hypothetical protein TNCV_4085531 [Trichonephila clavipes]